MDPTILRVLTYEVLNNHYPEPEWLRIFTDGSLLSDGPNAGAGVFSEAFSFYAPVGRGSAFDGEVAAIYIALSQLHCHTEQFTKAVVLCDSRAALLAIVSFNNPLTQDILKCRQQLENLASLEKTIVLQWVPAHCGVTGNENADYLAKKGASITQTHTRTMPFCSVKHLVRGTLRTRAHEELINRISHKSWRTAIPNLCSSPRHRAVAEFRLATGHDCLRKHLHRFGIVPSPVCTLCSLGEDMDSAHLLRCPALHKISLTERYWEARDMLD